MLGAPGAVPTVNEVLLVADPAGVVTVIGPVVAPAGTLVTIWLGLDEITVAAVPLKATVFWAAVVLNAVPQMVTVAPTTPLPGLNLMIAV